MPTYEYACRDCGEHLEVVQSFKDDALTTCPACQGQLRKVFSAAGLIFKGSGWHVKDYATSARKGSASDSAGSSTDTSTTEATSTDAPAKDKPAATGSEAASTSPAPTKTSPTKSADKKSA